MSADTIAIFGATFGSIPSPHSVTTAASAHSGVSPSNSSAEDFDFDFQGDESEEHDDFGVAFANILGGQPNQDGELSPSIEDKGENGKKRSRRPPSTAAKRATHNAVERARRESLNGRFMELAHVLPNMSMSKRPSKNSIVEHAIEYVGTAERRDRAITAENASLLTELNQLRARLGMSARPAFEPVIEAPTGKPPSKRPSTVQDRPVSVAAPAPVNVVAPTPAVAKAVKSPAEISPRTASAPAVVPMPQVPALMYPAASFDWSTTQFHGSDVFNLNAFDPTVYAPGTQTGGVNQLAYFAWPPAANAHAGMPFMPTTPITSLPGLA